MDHQYLTVEDVALLLQVPKPAVNRLVREGKLACFEISRKKRVFSMEHVHEFLESQLRPLPKKTSGKFAVRLPSRKKGGERSGKKELDRAQIKKELCS